MNEQTRNLLIFGALIGAGYYAFTRYAQSGMQALNLQKTRRITQEIKHQILIVSINFAQGAKNAAVNMSKTNPGKTAELEGFFTEQMTKVYGEKQTLILDKHSVGEEQYGLSLQRHKNDPRLRQMQEQIIEMMSRAVRGEYPDLTVDKRAKDAFNRQQIKKLYEDMSKMILVLLINKLNGEKELDPYFDPSNDAMFRKVVRDINIYERKVEFFKEAGFKDEWGCPNETFFKYSESLKIQDPEYKKQMARLETIYEKIVDVITKDPSTIKVSELDDYYNESKSLGPQASANVIFEAQPKVEQSEEVQVGASYKQDQSERVEAVPLADLIVQQVEAKEEQKKEQPQKQQIDHPVDPVIAEALQPEAIQQTKPQIQQVAVVEPVVVDQVIVNEVVVNELAQEVQVQQPIEAQLEVKEEAVEVTEVKEESVEVPEVKEELVEAQPEVQEAQPEVKEEPVEAQPVEQEQPVEAEPVEQEQPVADNE